MSWRFFKVFTVLGLKHSSSSNPASTDDPESQLDMLRKVQLAHEAYASALSELKKADIEFSGTLAGPAVNISRAELDPYMSAAVACVQVAEALYKECPNLPYFEVARTKCKSISKAFEAARACFEAAACGEQIGPDTLPTYRKALSAFVDSISEVQEMVANVITRGGGNRYWA